MLKLEESLIKNITVTFGEKGELWLESIQSIVNNCIDMWGLTDIKTIKNQTYNFVLMAKSKEYGEVLLKISPKFDKQNQEYSAITMLDSPYLREVYEFSSDYNALLMRLIEPGDTLHSLDDRDKQLEIGLNLVRGIAKEFNKPVGLSSFKEWIIKAFDYARDNSLGGNFLLSYIKRAEGYYKTLEEEYRDKYIIHGDFHHDNILLSHKDWIVIDPKGATGFWFTDCGRFLINHIWKIPVAERKKELPHIIQKASDHLKLPKEVIIKSIFIETVLCYSWMFQGNYSDTELEALEAKMVEEVDIYINYILEGFSSI